MVSVRVKDFLINFLIASILAGILFTGFLFRKQLQEFGYLVVGKLFPGPHVKIKGTEVKGFVDGKKIDHLSGVVTEIIPGSGSDFRVKIEQQGEIKEILISSNTQIYFGDKTMTQDPNNLIKGELEDIKVGNTLILDDIEKTKSGETKIGFVIVVRDYVTK